MRLQKFCPRALRLELWTRNLLLHHTLQFERNMYKERYQMSKRELDIHEYYLWFRYGLPPIFVNKSHWVEKIQNTSTFLQDPRKDFFISSEGDIHSIKKNRIVYAAKKLPSKMISFPTKISGNASICICSISNAKYLQSLLEIV